MQRFISVCLLSLLSSVILCSTTPACINDGTVFETEAEFKSQYLNQPVDDSNSLGDDAIDPDLYALAVGGSGVSLLIGAVVVAGVVMPQRQRAGDFPRLTETDES